MDKFVIEKDLGHNLSDRAEFLDEREAYEKFAGMDGTRRIGITNSNGDMFLLETAGRNLPKLLELKEDNPRLLHLLHGIRERWLIQSAVQYQKTCRQEVKQILEAASAPTSGRQGTLNFSREIKKRMDTCKKVFINHRMEGFDFRQTDLEDAIFINCSLAGSNFSHVNLQNAVFVNCSLDKTVWYEAFMNNAFIYCSDTVMPLKELKEVKGAYHGRI